MIVFPVGIGYYEDYRQPWLFATQDAAEAFVELFNEGK
jgi:hypothetical protein